MAFQDLIADADDQVLLGVAEPAGRVVDQRGRFLDDGIGGNHLPRDQVVADAECSRDRCVCAPQSLSPGTLTGPRLSYKAVGHKRDLPAEEVVTMAASTVAPTPALVNPLAPPTPSQCR
jgi:hypothetical protein